MDRSTLGKIVITAAVAVGGVGFLVKSSVSHAQKYKMVDDLLKDDMSAWKGKKLQVHGWVEMGSIHEKVVDQQTHRTFLLAKDGKKLRVFSDGPKPDTFKDASEVIATGELMPSANAKALADALAVPLETDLPYVLVATELSAKCPSRYNGAKVNQQLDPNFK
jgi:cytochrome c-type biogenesis protein CcmE